MEGLPIYTKCKMTLYNEKQILRKVSPLKKKALDAGGIIINTPSSNGTQESSDKTCLGGKKHCVYRYWIEVYVCLWQCYLGIYTLQCLLAASNLTSIVRTVFPGPITFPFIRITWFQTDHRQRPHSTLSHFSYCIFLLAELVENLRGLVREKFYYTQESR